MSILKVQKIRHTASNTDVVDIASDGTCRANITNNLSNRNKIINGGMAVSQRQTSTTNSNAFIVDRFQGSVTQMDQLAQTLEQSSDAPDGFSKSIKITTTTPETSIDTNEQFRVQTKLEGQDFQDLAYGTSAAKTITISFYVKASVTGTFGFTVYREESTDRVITAPYTINSANTWERKIITITGDTAGPAITNDNTERFRLMWGLAAGSQFNTASSSWSNYSSANLLGGHVTNTLVTTNNATWQLAGVQLEIGDYATDFEHRSYGDELLKCARYCYVVTRLPVMSNAASGYVSCCSRPNPVPMRASPSLSKSGGITFNAFFENVTPPVTYVTPSLQAAVNDNFIINFSGFSSTVNNRFGDVYGFNYLIMSAEL